MQKPHTCHIGQYFLLLLGLLIAITTTALADADFTPQFQPTLKISRANSPIEINGELDDPAWKTASKAANFAERSPGDNVAPEVATEAYVTYDAANLYIAFVCHDDPSTLRATMSQRDQFSGDDAVIVLIDTYGKATQAYEFWSNPYGVQKDCQWSSIIGEDYGYDLIWKSAAQITDSGYQVEMAIPFGAIRFPDRDVQNWKFDLWRIRPRGSYYQYSWSANNRSDQCWVCQWGTVEGIRSVHPGRGVEVMPTWVASQSSRLADLRDPDSPFKNGDPKGEPSLTAKYSLSSDATVEAALNPDFSQIEADARQIDVNTTIALFYPERRPFFQEGSDIFQTLFNSFYTRTVNDPEYAAKFTARKSDMHIGVISALDDNSPYVIPLTEGTIIVNTGKSLVNVARATHNLGANSQIGAIITDRRYDGGGYGTIMALDGDIRLSQNYRIDGQFLYSLTGEPGELGPTDWLQGTTFNDGKHTLAFDGEEYQGAAFISRFRRNGRHWNFFVDYNQVAPDYRTQTGYDPWVDYRSASAYTGYTFYIQSGLFERITPQLYTDGRWRFDGDQWWNNFQASVSARLRFAQTQINTNYHVGNENWSGVSFDNLQSVFVSVDSRPLSQMGFGFNIRRGQGVAFATLDKGNEISVGGYLDLKPIDRIRIEPNISYARSTHVDTDAELYKQTVTRTRLRYQASRALSLRLVVQYDDYRRAWNIDPLFTYRISPFSVAYIGSTYDYQDFSVNTNEPSRWDLQSRQFFMKLQYLFQI